jgi:hypothetical protein
VQGLISGMGHSLPKWVVHAMPAFHPIVSIEPTCQEVRFVPISGSQGANTSYQPNVIS